MQILLTGSSAGKYASQRFTAGCAAHPKGCSTRCVPLVAAPDCNVHKIPPLLLVALPKKLALVIELSLGDNERDDNARRLQVRDIYEKRRQIT